MNKEHVLGVVGEFNPFHDGHRYLIDSAKAELGDSTVVAVMSGNFLQRGEPAVFNKWKRATEAVASGYLDLVLELPTIYAVSSAGYFARGSVTVLEGFGVCDTLIFGSESGNIDILKRTADMLSIIDSEYGDEIRALMKEGISYPLARHRVLENNFIQADESIPKSPNNILALEYIQAATYMDTFTVKREGDGYHKSASDIRKRYKAFDPKHFDTREKKLFDLIRSSILVKSAGELEEASSAGEGLGNKLLREIRYANTREELIERVKSKRYTYTRIQRLLIEILLGIKKQDLAVSKPYIKVLAMNNRGALLIKYAKKAGLISIPIVDSVAKTMREDEDIAPSLKFDIRASDMFNLIDGEDLYRESDYVRKPVLIG